LIKAHPASPHTDEALKKYLKEHPDADKSKHSVKKKEDEDASQGE
jgi:hypothetical protein